MPHTRPDIPAPPRDLGRSFIRRHPVAAYFVLTYAISWTAALLVVAPKLARGEPLTRLDGILMFPAMLVGPSAAGIILAGIVDAPHGRRRLLARMGRVRVGIGPYLSLLLPPALVLIVLLAMRTIVSPAFAPNHYLLGISFGVPAGFLEEIGWTGFALPHMKGGRNTLWSAIGLGLVWGCWHLPVVNYLGAATPHGAYWFRYFLAFAAAMVAMRVIIAWVYAHSHSLLIAQLLHVSSTAALVVFSPPVSAAQEVAWYWVYAAALWLIVGLIVARHGRELGPAPNLEHLAS